VRFTDLLGIEGVDLYSTPLRPGWFNAAAKVADRAEQDGVVGNTAAAEVVPGLVELEVVVPRLSPASR